MQQTILIAGDTLKYLTSIPAYPASQGFTATTRLVRRDAVSAAIVFSATASGDDYQFNVAPATTLAWVTGRYTWSLYVTKAGERYTVDSGELEVRVDPATATAPLDQRSHARKVLLAIEAVLENRATTDQQAISIAGRQVTRMPIIDLLVLRDRYRAEVANEDASAGIAAGKKNPRFIGVRFGRA